MVRKIMHVVGKIVFSRTMIILLMMAVQAGFLFAGFAWLDKYINYLYGSFSALTALVVVYLVNKQDIPEFKIAWLIPICVFPVFGALLFLYVATIPLLIMWPILFIVYYRLARKEEQDMMREFGEQYAAYKKRTGMFLPKLK